MSAREPRGVISVVSDVVERWGATDAEVADRWPCDTVLTEPADALFRAVTVAAPVPIVFRWLCQLRVAPSSYDWIDNRGRTSPRELVPGLEELAVGQRFCSIFRLVGFTPDDQLTILSSGPVFGEVVITYRVRPDPRGTRLAAKLLVRYPGPPWGWLMRALLPAADLVMMHKQLTNLAGLAERTAAGAGLPR